MAILYTSALLDMRCLPLEPHSRSWREVTFQLKRNCSTKQCAYLGLDQFTISALSGMERILFMSGQRKQCNKTGAGFRAPEVTGECEVKRKVSRMQMARHLLVFCAASKLSALSCLHDFSRHSNENKYQFCPPRCTQKLRKKNMTF